MTEEASSDTVAAPERTKLLKGSRWPKDRYGQEVDVGDYMLFTNYSSYPVPAFGRVVRIGKTGKVHVQTVKVHPKDTVSDIEIKRCEWSAIKLSPNMSRAIMMEKLSLAS